jgi:2-polyprenyl-3-methyl-5-hydroxy-6-metoxy-1,4-benzoquinol methylase
MSMTRPMEERTAKEYWETRLSERWGLHGVGHISFGLPYNEWLYRVRKQVFLRQIQPLSWDFKALAVLDVGSGTGFWLDQWKSLGVRSITGLDITRIAAENLQETHPEARILELDISDPEAPQKISQKFDVISAFDVLFHIADKDKFDVAISNVAALLKPSGHFVFSDLLVHAQPTWTAQEVHRTLDTVTEVLAQQNLQIRRRVPMFVLMNSPFDASSRFLRYLWLLLMAPVRFLPALGSLYGAALYPLELLLTNLLTESPTTEMVICQKGNDFPTNR